jgi:hypothetical protein
VAARSSAVDRITPDASANKLRLPVCPNVSGRASTVYCATRPLASVGAAIRIKAVAESGAAGELLQFFGVAARARLGTRSELAQKRRSWPTTASVAGGPEVKSLRKLSAATLLESIACALLRKGVFAVRFWCFELRFPTEVVCIQTGCRLCATRFGAMDPDYVK